MFHCVCVVPAFVFEVIHFKGGENVTKRRSFFVASKNCAAIWRDVTNENVSMAAPMERALIGAPKVVRGGRAA